MENKQVKIIKVSERHYQRIIEIYEKIMIDAFDMLTDNGKLTSPREQMLHFMEISDNVDLCQDLNIEYNDYNDFILDFIYNNLLQDECELESY